MLFRSELIAELAETLEGLVLPESPTTHVGPTILVFHPRDKERAKSEGASAVAPVIEIDLLETGNHAQAVVHSALGMLELRDIEELRLSRATEEAAFFMKTTPGLVSVVTISSRGVLQVYLNIPSSVAEKDFNDLNEDDLRAAVALKIFSEGARVFTHEIRTVR